ncbi:phage holin family protein [Arthrobacter crystallopoietes]|uniref:phage holin family protein n=1 Tax=Crystallibacter crystallopoietes TaxID=37928 RepID=UPI003D24987A
MTHPNSSGAHSYEVPPTEAEERAANASLGDILGDVSRDMSTLMRQELELAKAELKESGTKAGKGAGLLGGAGVAGHFVLVFLSLALTFALGALIGLGWSAVIVAVIWAIVAAVLAAMGKKALKEVRGMPQTAETVKEIPPTLKPGEETP